MTTNQKMDFLCNLDETSALYDNNVKTIRQCCVDGSAGVRSFAARVLVYFTDETAKDLLLRLAKDRNAMVRTESYDSLTVFPFEEVQSFLYHAIQTEVDNLARNYAIMSFADVTVALKKIDPAWMAEIARKKSLEKNAHCSLSYCYAAYLFVKAGFEWDVLDASSRNGSPLSGEITPSCVSSSEEKASMLLEELLAFLTHDDYHIRCGTINLLDDIGVMLEDMGDMTNDNYDMYIKEHLSKLLETEEVYAVISTAETFLEELLEEH